MMRTLAILVSGLVAVAQPAHAQAAASAPSGSSSKKEMVQRVVGLQQPALDSMARNLAEQPVRQMMSAADAALRIRIPPEKRQAIANQINEAMRKYLDEANPLVRERATRMGQASLSGLFDEKFSEDEIRQLLAVLESPVYKKFQQSLPDLSNAFVQKLIRDIEPVLEPKLKALEQRVAQILGATSAAAPASTTRPATGGASRTSP